MNDLYEADLLLWSEHQAELLRRRAAGALVNDRELDWANLAEEIEDVGRSEFRTVESLLGRALRHMLNAQGWPDSRDAPAWLADAIDFRQQAASRFAPSMRHRIDLDRLYARALRATPATIDGRPPLPLPQACPVTLDALLAE